MKNFLSLLARQYRLGLCGALVAVDVLIMFAFLADILLFINKGYEAASIETLPSGIDLARATVSALGAIALMLLILPLAVASIRVLVTPFKMPHIDWPTRRIVMLHCLLTLLIAVAIVACVRMEIASGLQFKPSSGKLGFVYTSFLESLLIRVGDAFLLLPTYFKSASFLYMAGGLILSYFTGREILRNERGFLSDYAAASKLVDCDPSYLPLKAAARRVTPVRSFAPASRAILEAVDRELDAFNRGQDGDTPEHSNLAKQIRNIVSSYLFPDANLVAKARILPDVFGCIYTAITNEDSDTIVLSSVNRPGVNGLVTTWFNRNKKLKVLGIDESRQLEAWAVQESVFIQAFEGLIGNPADRPGKVLIVLPLISSHTGQVFDVRSIIEKIRARCNDAVVVVDGSYLNVAPGMKLDDLYGADYLCLDISQWITCPEPCGVMLSKRTFSVDPDWETREGFAPANTRTVAAFYTAFEHAFQRSVYFNDPKGRTEILMQKFLDAMDPRLLSVVQIPDLVDRTYFLTVQPSKGKTWDSEFADKLANLGLSSGLRPSSAQLTIAFPPYVDYWQVGRLAGLLGQSVV